MSKPILSAAADDGWETITTDLGGGKAIGITVSWRAQGGRKSKCLVVALGIRAAEAIGLAKFWPGSSTTDRMRAHVQRNRMRGRIRVSVADRSLPRDKRRAVAWKDGGCAIVVPLDDVTLTDRKPAQDVPWEIIDVAGKPTLEIKLPAWACPPVQITGGRAA